MTNPALAPIYLDLIASSSDSTLPANAWEALQTFQREAVVAACQAALTSGDEKKVQAAASLIAAHLKEPALGEAIQAALTKSEDRTTLLLGLSALSCVEADRFSEYFKTQLAHDDPQVRASAVSCLAQCKEVNLYETLEKTLADADKRVRAAALMALQNAAGEHLPQDRVVEYFTPSLLSPDKETRAAAIAAIAPHITQDNGEAVLAVMQKMQNEYGADGTKPLMQAVFRMVPEEKSAEILETQGYVTRWHVIGAFPSGFATPGADVDGFTIAYPPEQEVDLTKRYNVKYNIQGDPRGRKEVNEVEIGWVPATVGDADGFLYMTKEGRSQQLMPRGNGVCYAYTEIILPDKKEARLEFLFNMKVQERVWLNGKALSLDSKVDAKQGTATKTAAVTLGAGKNRLLVKVATNNFGKKWSVGFGSHWYALRPLDLEGKPVKWSYE